MHSLLEKNFCVMTIDAVTGTMKHCGGVGLEAFVLWDSLEVWMLSMVNDVNRTVATSLIAFVPKQIMH